MQHPILYSFRRCPYAMRARMALLASGITCELREIALKAKPQAMLDASPKGTVPVLVLPDNTVIDESLDIMLWASSNTSSPFALSLSKGEPAEAHSTTIGPCNTVPQHWLTPETESLQAMLDVIAQNDGAFKHHLDRYKYPNRYENVDALEHRAAGAEFLLSLETRLARHAFLFGTRPALADIALFPFVRQFAETDRTWFDAQPWPHLHTWLAGLIASPLFTQVMEKLDPWQPGQSAVLLGVA